jgi:NADP-reducing hydrogenase subunit HndB
VKKSIADLAKIREEALKNMQLREHSDGARVVVGMGTCGISSGARQVLSAIVEEVNKRDLNNIKVVQTGCVGLCRLEPMFDVYMDDQKVTYVNMTPEKARQMVVEHLVNQRVIYEYTIGAVSE